MDQEKVTRVDFLFNAVRNTCIFRPRYLEITENYIEIKKKTKTNTNKRIKHTNHKATLN